MSKKIKYQIERCKGCHYCLQSCPFKAISLDGQTNSGGYKIVKFDEEKCTACGTCYTVCPDYCITVTKSIKEK